MSKKPRSEPVGVIDLGSNTVLLLVAGPYGQVQYEASRITRIGKGVFASGRLDPARVADTREAVIDFAKIARQRGARPLVLVATEALRRTSEGGPFLEALRQAAELDQALLLSGDDEARYTIEASRLAYADESGALVVADIGGGSTELAWLQGEEIHGVSLPLGTVRLTEAEVHSDPPTPADLARVAAACDRALAGDDSVPGSTTWPWQAVAVAGTATTLAALDQELSEYAAERVEGYPFNRARLRGWVKRLAGLSLTERQRLTGMERGRADVILAGLVILERVWARLGVEDFRISGRGVRHGVALALLEGDGPL